MTSDFCCLKCLVLSDLKDTRRFQCFGTWEETKISARVMKFLKLLEGGFIGGDLLMLDSTNFHVDRGKLHPNELFLHPGNLRPTKT